MYEQNLEINSSSEEPPVSKLDDFCIGKGLGTGRFGRVFLAKTKNEGYLCALKILFKKQLVKYSLEKQFIREVEIMIHLNHPNVLKLYTWFHDDRRIFLVLEYALRGQMYSLLNKHTYFKDPRAAHYNHQLCDALIYLHSRNVIHRDIKPENLLISADDNLKLADFGWSIHTKRMSRKTRCGTTDYLSPEIVNRSHYDERIDIWCVGVLLYEMLCGKPPFEDEDDDKTHKNIRDVDYEFTSRHTDAARKLIGKILVLCPKKRISLQNIQRDVWSVSNRALFTSYRHTPLQIKATSNEAPPGLK